MPAEVTRLMIVRRELTAERVPALEELFRLPRMPLGETDIEVELRGVPTAVASALRRTLTDEMLGHSLRAPLEAFAFGETADPYMLPPFVLQRISLVRLRAQISPDVEKNLELELDVMNNRATELSVYSGDMKVAKGTLTEPLFNPTTRLAVLQPGRRITIRNIRIESGYGRDDAAFNVACCGANRPLDIPEYTPDEIRRGPIADWSGFKISSLVADPRHHRVSVTLPATSPVEAEARVVLVDACDNIVARLRRVEAAVATGAAREGAAAARGSAAHESKAQLAEARLAGLALPRGAAQARSQGIRLTVAQLEGGLEQATLHVPGETATLGALLTRTIYEAVPTVSCVRFDGSLTVTVDYAGDAAEVMRAALRSAAETFGEIRQGIADAVVETEPRRG